MLYFEYTEKEYFPSAMSIQPQNTINTTKRLRNCYILLWVTSTGYGFRRCDLKSKLHVLSPFNIKVIARNDF